MRKLLLVIAALLPQPVKLLIYRRLLGWQIGKNVQIGWSFLDAHKVTLGDNVRIGHFNLIRGLKQFSIGEGTYIANLNQMFGANYPGWDSTLTIGSRVNFMSRHFIDIGGTVTIGDRAVIGGRDTQFWSHTREAVGGKEALHPTTVRVGNDAYIGARATLISCAIPAGAVVGAGSVVTKSFPAEEARLLIAGNPATIRKRYEPAPEKETREENML